LEIRDLIHVVHGGDLPGTWIHPGAAVELARFISPDFAVWMDRWFLDLANQARPAPVEVPVAPQLRGVEMMALAERFMDLMDRCGGADDRDAIMVRDIGRNALLAAAGGNLLPAAPADPEITLGDAYLEVLGRMPSRGQLCAVGKLAANLYREDFGQEPPQRQQFVDGAPRQVKSYRRAWLIGALQRLGLASD
jgi:hypothetical protein